MKELQRQDSLTQQQYKNELAEREYQDTLRQQQFSNDLASEKLNIAKGEWALKQSKAAQSARQASTNASAKAESGLSGSGLTAREERCFQRDAGALQRGAPAQPGAERQCDPERAAERGVHE